MRDPGLFTGPTKMHPPSSMASQLFLAWATSIGDFAISLWMDREVDDERAGLFTEWAMSECLPTTPRGTGALGQVLAALMPMAVLSQAILRSATSENVERTNQGLLAIAKALRSSRGRIPFTGYRDLRCTPGPGMRT